MIKPKSSKPTVLIKYGMVKKGNVICCEISEKESLLILEFITA